MIWSNLLWIEWISFSSSTLIMGIFVIIYSNLVPEIVHRTFKYGKTAEPHIGQSKKLKVIEVPKRYAQLHFNENFLFLLLFFVTNFFQNNHQTWL